MTPESREVLRQFGEALDHDRTVRVHIGGLISFDRANQKAVDQENENEQRREPRGPAAGSWQGAAGRKGSSDRSRKAGSWSRVRSLRTAYEAQLSELEEAYPTLRTFDDEDGMWLLIDSAVFAGLDTETTFLVALPFAPYVGPRAWAFWKTSAGFRWIGDRHTNFFDGSICAFSPTENAWQEGEDLATLIDLYSVWAARHLHFEVVGHWPGRHYALLDQFSFPDPYYRLIEVRDDELCTCGGPGARYRTCCKPSDLGHDFLKLKAAFEGRNKGRSIRSRAPPQSVVAFIDGDRNLPPMREVHEPLRAHLLTTGATACRTS